MFYLALVDGPTERVMDEYGTFDTGRAAAEAARQVQIGHAWCKVQPRPVKDNTWRERATREVADQKPFPEGWDIPQIADHYAYLDTEKGHISFYDGILNAMIGRRTSMKPGRYLTANYDLDENRRKKLIGLLSPNVEIKFATTAAEMEWVYEHGPNSCMTRIYHREDGEDFASLIHPVRVYAAGDLAVAYRLSTDGKSVSERCLCWPDQQMFSRCYSDGSERLVTALEARGWMAAEGDDLAGARLRRCVQHAYAKSYDEDDSDNDRLGDLCFVLPYIDAGLEAGSGSRFVYDDGQFLRIASGYDLRTRECTPCCNTIGLSTARFASKSDRAPTIFTQDELLEEDN